MASGMDDENEVSKPSTVVKISVFVGIWIVHVFSGICFIWGNLTVYVTSYFYATDNVSTLSSLNSLLLVNVVGERLGYLIGGMSINKIGCLPTLFVATTILNISLILSYFALLHSALALMILIGVIPGICTGISTSCQLVLNVNWTEKYYGVAINSTQTTPMFGSLLTNYFLTNYINPNNEKANSFKNGARLFAQTDIINNVPRAMLIFGCFSAAVHFIGLSMIRTRPGNENTVREIIKWLTNKRGVGGNNVKNDERSRLHDQNSVNSNKCYDDDDTESCFMKVNHSCSHNEEEKSRKVQEVSNESTNNDVILSLKNKSSIANVITPKQALKMRSFYALVIITLGITFGINSLNNYYKTFGLLFINDDHFLTSIIEVKLVSTAIMAWIVGACIDKLGVKLTLVITSSMYTVITSLFYFTPAINKWLYMFAVVMYACCLFPSDCAIMNSCLLIFGQTHFTSIMGMVYIGTYILPFVQPLLMEWMISKSGYFPLYISTAVLGFLNVIICIIGVPERV